MSTQYSSITKILKEYGIRPDKSLGQNFLTDPTIIKKITGIAGIQKQDTILEIGAGIGHLTIELAANSSRVVAVELDHRLIPILREHISGFDNVEIIPGDILELDLKQLSLPHRYLVVANIPYYITSILIRHLSETSHPPESMVLTIQREVAERICQPPGKLNLLAISVQVYGEPGIRAHIPAGAFYPAPDIDSSVIRIIRHPEPLIPEEHLKLFFRLVKAGFSQKRKTLRNSISGGMGWEPSATGKILNDSGIDPSRRAETLSIQEWYQITLFTKNYLGIV